MRKDYFLVGILISFFGNIALSQDWEMRMVGHIDPTEFRLLITKQKNGKTETRQFICSPEASTAEELNIKLPDTQKNNISFLLGSCAYRGTKGSRKEWFMGKKRYNIYNSMTRTPSDFMIWLGDHVYFEGKEFSSGAAMLNKYIEQRSDERVRRFMTSRPQYAIWDDHDYGPDDTDGSYAYKDTSLAVFKKMWANPSYGTEETKGIFTHFRWGEAEFFLTDGRYHRDIPNKKLLGEAQLHWLKERLLNSTADFKFICMGTQYITNSHYGEQAMRIAPEEQKELIDFLEAHHITGVIFLTGDRHYSEASCLKRPNAYPLYEFTCSGMTSFLPRINIFANKNKIRGTFVGRYNYGRISLQGEGKERYCQYEIFGRKGKRVRSIKVFLKDLE